MKGFIECLITKEKALELMTDWNQYLRTNNYSVAGLNFLEILRLKDRPKLRSQLNHTLYCSRLDQENFFCDLICFLETQGKVKVRKKQGMIL
jgi:hypothetical protein